MGEIFGALEDSETRQLIRLPGKVRARIDEVTREGGGPGGAPSATRD